MGIRFRKSFGNKHFRVNLSKSGIGYSAGVKGARITRTARGTTRTTASIPNTGISYTSETSGRKKKKAAETANVDMTIGRRAYRIIYGVCSAVIMPFSLLLMTVGEVRKFAIALFIFGVILAILSHKHRKKAA